MGELAAVIQFFHFLAAQTGVLPREPPECGLRLGINLSSEDQTTAIDFVKFEQRPGNEVALGVGQLDPQRTPTAGAK